MSKWNDSDDPRRRQLIQALAAGVFTAALPGSDAFAQTVLGNLPGPLPPGRSIFRMSGEVTINGAPATLASAIKPGDTLVTGKDSELVFIVDDTAMILRAGSNVTLESRKPDIGSILLTGLRMLTGKLLSVSRNKPMQLRTTTATIGIRGTGLYIEADPELTYFCTCYGATDVVSNDDPESRDSVVATHHDKPLYITSGASKGRNVRAAGFKNHTDQELMLIESLVGRSVPFVFPGGDYTAPRTRY